MDLERLGTGDLADRFTGWYSQYSGDPAPTSLRHHYTAYRAFVRAKVTWLRCHQGDPRAGGEARELAALALQHLRAGAVTLVLIGGLPGTGKSALAGTLAGRWASPCWAATGSARNWPASPRNRNLPPHMAQESTTGSGPSAPTKSCFTGPRSCSPAASQ